MKPTTLALLSALAAAGCNGGGETATAAPAATSAANAVTPAEARAIAKDAYVYAEPMVDSYRIEHAYFVNRENPEFKAPWNTPE